MDTMANGKSYSSRGMEGLVKTNLVIRGVLENGCDTWECYIIHMQAQKLRSEKDE
jgi:hypothetical protein